MAKYIWTVYLRNLGLVSCASEKDALAIKAEWLKRHPEQTVAQPVEHELATVASFFNEVVGVK